MKTKPLVCLSLLVAGVALPAPAAAGPFENRRARRAGARVCLDDASAITEAPNPEQLRGATRGWLGCLAGRGVPPVHLDRDLAALVRANPYEAVSREAANLIAHFSDPTQVRDLPRAPEQTVAYLALLDDQALYARAAGDASLEKAIAQRRTRVRRFEALLALTESN